VANVWNAMKKHQREEAERDQQARQVEQAEQATQAEQPAQISPVASAAGVDVPDPVTEAAPSITEVEIKAPMFDPARNRVSVPANAENNYAEALVTHHDRGGRISEEYRELRTSLLAQSRDERFCYLVTSANPGEGKTVSCLNLAFVMAERQERMTIVVDCDLRKGTVTKMLNSKAKVGVADILRGQVTLKDVIESTVYPNLFCIPAGEAQAGEVGDLLGRPETHEMVAELRRQYDYVLFDTPPINMVSDARMLGSAGVDALLVVRMNKTHRESIEKAISLLQDANIKVGGMVLTHQKYFIPNYLYRYT